VYNRARLESQTDSDATLNLGDVFTNVGHQRCGYAVYAVYARYAEINASGTTLEAGGQLKGRAV